MGSGPSSAFAWAFLRVRLRLGRRARWKSLRRPCPLAPPVAADKFRIVLDYLPCGACLEIPVPDQDLHCSLCRRMTRSVGVASHTDVAVLVESPAMPLPVEVPPAPPEPIHIEPASEADEVPPAPAPLAAADEGVPEDDDAVSFAAAPEAEEDLDLAFEATAEAAEEDVDLAFEATRGEPEPEPFAEEVAEATPPPPFTFDPGSLEPHDGFAPAADDDAATLDREAEAWAEAAAEPEEVELQPVRPEEAWSRVPPAPPPEPEEWTPEPVPEAPADAWPEEVVEEAPAEYEILEVVDEEPVAAAPAEDAWAEAPPLEPPVEEALPAESSAEYEVLEVVEDEPVAAEPAPGAAPAEPAWEDDAWPDEAPAPAAPVDAWADDAPPPAPADPWPEEGAPIEAAAEEPATPPTATAVEDPVTRIDGLGPMYAERLLAQGVQTLRELGAQDAGKLAKATGVSPKLVKRWVGVASLASHGVPMAYADALFEAGYENPRDLRRGKPDKVAKALNKVISGRADGTDPVDPARISAWQGAT